MTAVIEVEQLRKEYRRRKGVTKAVDGLDLTVPEGGVFGFLGPNGSGKTTTIRCLLGLVAASSGRTALFGKSGPRALSEVMPRIGAIVISASVPACSNALNMRAGLSLTSPPNVSESRNATLKRANTRGPLIHSAPAPAINSTRVVNSGERTI